MAGPPVERPASPETLDPRGEAPGINTPGTKSHPPSESPPATAGFSDPPFDEKKDDSEEMPESEEEESGEVIVYHYLTYSTELPLPTSVYPTSDGQEPPPEMPSLKNYENPFDWPAARKNMTVYIACFITALTAFSAGSYSPGVGQMTQEWHVSSVAAFVGITMFTCGKHSQALYSVPVQKSPC